MSSFERKYGKYALPNLSLWVVAAYALGYFLQMAHGSLLGYMTLDPYAILFRGQLWRLLSWIMVPPSTFDLLTILMLVFYYYMGNTLERVWGTYRYNVYIFGGMGLTILASFVGMGLSYALYGDSLLADAQSASAFFQLSATLFSTYYINLSIFLAYAVTFPEATVLLMMILPIKVKWLGTAYGIYLTLQFFSGVGDASLNIFYRMSIGASLVNFLIFWFFTAKRRVYPTPRQILRKQQFQKEVKRSKVTRHKCAVCGRTEEDGAHLSFRYCSKCNGNYEYCQDHLFTHEHKK